jgi:hypothetical protein
LCRLRLAPDNLALNTVAVAQMGSMDGLRLDVAYDHRPVAVGTARFFLGCVVQQKCAVALGVTVLQERVKFARSIDALQVLQRYCRRPVTFAPALLWQRDASRNEIANAVKIAVSYHVLNLS